ncbi:MAG: hypothetical protein Udaeo2_25770 [Candidatus Udaeobacter sp.]|nr:MAG: hypothetical protein Udaeo2_25770 [Candidatus Udaeobacter sp.]
MTGTVAIVFALGPQKETVEPAKLTHRIKTIEAPGKHFVDVALMTDVHNEPVVRRVEDPVQGNRQFHDTEIWAQMPSGLGKDADQLFPHFLCELWQILFAQRFDFRRRADPIEQARWRCGRLGSPSRLRRV